MTSRRTAFVLAWSLWGLWVVMAVLYLWAVWNAPIADESLLVVALVMYATVGALVVARLPGNAVGWLMMAIAFTLVLQSLGEAYVYSRSNPGYVAVAWLASTLFSVWLLLVASFLPLVFPTGHLPSRRWRPVWWFSVATLIASIVAQALAPGELAVQASIDNPLGVHGAAATVVKVVEVASWFAMAVAVACAVLSLLLRFRASRGIERQQLQWFALAAVTTVAGLAASALGEVGLPRPWGQLIGDGGWIAFALAGIIGVPVAMGIAVLRHRLYDIDVVINRALVYGTLTAALATVYVGSVLLLRLLLSPVAGDSGLAVAGSTLAVAALFRPVRARIQAGVDRRFFRSRYDASRTLRDFTLRLRHEIDLDAMATDLCATVDQAVPATHVSLWIRAGRTRRMDADARALPRR